MTTENSELWERVKERLSLEVPDATLGAWLSSVVADTSSNGTLKLLTPSSLVQEHFERHLREPAVRVASQLAGRPVSVTISFDPTISVPSAATEVENQSAARQEGASHSRYTFETFVIGPSNRFAHAAALSVAESPGRSYNPLFIHGGAGLGKTHLLRAIENYVTENFPSLLTRYVSTETFMNEFVDAIRTNTNTAFKRRYRECDVLLIDDVQFLEGKEGLQEEFFHTFNSLYEASKQVVLTSDRPPKALATIEQRLKSRFMSGLITDVQPPDLETRLAILRFKAERAKVVVPEEILDVIASHIKDNIRELEGALNRVIATAHLNGAMPSVEQVKELLSDLVGDPAFRAITPKAIIKATAEMYGLSEEEIVGADRRKPVVLARQIGMYVTRELTDYSYPAIAREFGGKDHTTVIHAVEKVTNLMQSDRDVYNQVTQLIKRIKGIR